ncbi:MAG: zonular occludens toxin domain-containing protein [bacterium]|nr:zonular occludens toxin domain-containing protein [bacterium]
MAIRIIQGVPGSGKTYYAVKHLANNYFEKQIDGRYELIKPCTIVTNIDSFVPDHISLSDAVKDAGGVKVFFTEDYQRTFTKEQEHQLIYIIDEAQKLFRKSARDLNDVYTYFEIHRHLGHDIYLITQNAKKLPTDLVVLTEYIIDAAPRSRSVIGEFKYKWLSDGEILKREAFKPDDGIFSLYKSMDAKESEKIKNPVMRTFYLVMFLTTAILFGGFMYFKNIWYTPHTEALAADPPAQATKASLQVATIADDNTVTIRLNRGSVVQRHGNHVFMVNYVFLGDRLYRVEKFPYPLQQEGNEFFASVPRHVAAEIERQRDDLANDSVNSVPATTDKLQRRNASDLSGAAHAAASFQAGTK